jgi:hypothetical protein
LEVARQETPFLESISIRKIFCQLPHPTSLGQVNYRSLVEGGACRWTPTPCGEKLPVGVSVPRH